MVDDIVIRSKNEIFKQDFNFLLEKKLFIIIPDFLIKIYAYVKTQNDVINGNNSSVTTKQDINENKTSAFRNWIFKIGNTLVRAQTYL